MHEISAIQDPSGALSDVMSQQLEVHRGEPFPPAAFDNFTRVFAISRNDRVLLLVDDELNTDVVEFIRNYARGRGAEVRTISVNQSVATCPEIPDDIRPTVAWATVVVSTWFASISHPFFEQLRRDSGQRWIKITYFRSLDLLYSDAASFPLEVISLLLKTTSSVFRDGEAAVIHVTDQRGTDLTIKMTAEIVRNSVLTNPRLRGDVTADNPGTFVHYLPIHGPNIYSRSGNPNHTDVNGVIVPQWSVGFAQPFNPPVRIIMSGNRVTSVEGQKSKDRDELAGMLIGSCLIELGVGFNPKWPREQLYPAGSNSPGALHFGLDLTEESNYIQRTMPLWNEPPVHMDLVDLDATVTVNGTTLVQDGFLSALRDESVVRLASHFGPATALLENWPHLESSSVDS